MFANWYAELNLFSLATFLTEKCCFWLVLLAAFWGTVERGWPFERRAISYILFLSFFLSLLEDDMFLSYVTACNWKIQYIDCALTSCGPQGQHTHHVRRLRDKCPLHSPRVHYEIRGFLALPCLQWYKTQWSTTEWIIWEKQSKCPRCWRWWVGQQRTWSQTCTACKRVLVQHYMGKSD